MPADVAAPRPRPADQDRFRAAVADALDTCWRSTANSPGTSTR
ncbi:hypothetical protein R0J91_17940 [Micrococcus sp. SIMBA_131]